MLKRVVFLLLLLFINLFACGGAYHICNKKVMDADVIVNQTLQIPIKKHQRVIFSNHKLSSKYKILKYNPFLHLYLVKDKKGFKYPFKINQMHKNSVFILSKTSVTNGKIVRGQIGLDEFATFSKCYSSPALLMDDCCSLEGIATSKGIIQKAYIKRFIDTKDISYGDIGMRVKDIDSKIIVIATDPFIKHNPFKIGDCIVKFNFKPIYSSSKLMKKILFKHIGSFCSVKIKRKNQFLTLKVIVDKRYGGGYLSDTFFEREGLYFDSNLCITKVKGKFKAYGLKVGDKLVQVNAKLVSKQGEVRESIEKNINNLSLLFEREHFQFFVNVN